MAVAYQYCTGPVHVFVAPNVNGLYILTPPSTGTALYLGTCEQYPIVEGEQMWEPTFNDIAGTRPFDKQYFGDSKVLALDINKMVQTTVDALINHGIETSLSRGLYKNLTNVSFTTWLQFQNYGTVAAVPGLPPGEVYFNCNIAKNGYNPIGTRSRKTTFVIEAEPAYTVNNALGNGGSGFVCYSIAPGYFSGLPLAA